MDLLDLFRRKDTGHGTDELARRLGLGTDQLAAIRPQYHQFTIPKRSGHGMRTIHAPSPELKAIQRRILRRLLGLLVAHPAATGFEIGKSIVTNALPHQRKAVIVRLDIKDFFASTKAKRVEAFFERIGWNREAARRLTDLCTHDGSLPQGAPTSPRLANLLNVLLDKRLEGAARKYGATYTRYADDMTFSFDDGPRHQVQSLINLAKIIVEGEGYQLHMKRKLSIRRRHDQQRVTGLVVNHRPNLPRTVRRKLRAAEHHFKTGKPATLTATQLQGWRALRAMIDRQT